MLSPASWAVVGLMLAVLFALPLVPLLIESNRAAGLAACSMIMAGAAILAGALALGAQSTQVLPDTSSAGEIFVVIGPYALLGGIAAAFLFALAAMVAQISRR